MCLKFNKIEHGSTKLAALERLKKSPLTYNGRNVVSTLVLLFWMDIHHSCRYQGKLQKMNEFADKPTTE